MARIAWVNIPDNKVIAISLTYIVWIGPSKSNKILDELKIEKTKRTKDLNEKELDMIRSKIAEHSTEVDIRREQAMNIKRLQEIWSYRWYRHRIWLPCRGQSTASNARTCKNRSGKRRMAIPGKKKI